MLRRQLRQARDALDWIDFIVPQLLDLVDEKDAQLVIANRRADAAEEAAKLEKKRRKCGKQIKIELPANTQGQAMFYSPRKIKNARAKFEQQQQQQRDEINHKDNDKIQRDAQKEWQAEEQAARKEEQR